MQASLKQYLDAISKAKTLESTSWCKPSKIVTLKLLEPVMRVEVITPEDYMGDVIGDLSSRRGQVSETNKRGNATVISAMVPLANMFGYINSLRSMSQGRAQYSMFFDHYSKVPQNVQDEVTKKIAG